MKPTFILNEISDKYVKENFQRIESANLQSPFTLGDFRILTIDIPGAVSNLRYAHNLGFQPSDVWTTYRSEDEIETWNYTLFNSEFLDISATGAMTLRAVVGRFK